eukprot:g24681.t1
MRLSVKAMRDLSSRIVDPSRRFLFRCSSSLSSSHTLPALLRSTSTLFETELEQARMAVAARQPKPFPNDPSRVQYRTAYPKTWRDRVRGRWRGQHIDLSHTHELWAQKESGDRHIENMFSLFRSDTFRRLLWPDLAFTLSVSVGVVLHNLWVEWENANNLFPVQKSGFNLLLHHDMLTLPPEPFTLSAFALGLILAFRTNTSHARYIEGRQLWGTLISLSRDLSSRFTAPIPRDETARKAQRRGAYLVATFAHTLKYLVTIDGCNQNIDVNTEDFSSQLDQALREELILIWGEDRDTEFLDNLLSDQTTHRPLFVLHELGRLSRSEALGLEPIAAAQIDDRLYELAKALGGCERLLRTPIYSPYTAHLSRFLFVWCSALPLALYPLVGATGTIPTSLLLTYFFLGIEDIGVLTENPFNNLPLWQHCNVIDASCQQILLHTMMYAKDKPNPNPT